MLFRDIQRKCSDPDFELQNHLALAERIFHQKRENKNKIYSVHAPEVECISKGKVYKRYEFGCKASVVSTSRGNWVVGIDAVHGNPYDGHTIERSLTQSTRLTGWKPLKAYCDRGYRGVSQWIPDVEIHLPKGKKKGLKRSVLKWLKRRSAIEPIIGHIKLDNRMERNHLQGKDGDRINAMLAGCGFNMRKLIKAFLSLIFRRLFFGGKPESDHETHENSFPSFA